jgi:Na+/melibiose symporter-like transporter|tara:strand:- start:5781 stop:7190 length:1410 start_codon:yes stop_codon:yes gene_type:complete
VSWRLRLIYAFGQLPEGIKSATFGFFLLFYYNQVLGLSGSMAGIAVFIALCLDALSDPVVGSWSDFTRSRWGRRHPFMYWSAIPFAASFYFLFVPPDGLSEFGLFMWLLVFAALTRTAMTFYSVPYMALGAELTNNYDERTLLAALRTVFNLLGMFIVLIGGNMVFFGATPEYANGQLNPDAYFPFALTCVPIMVLGIWAAAAGTHGQIPHLEQPQGVRQQLLRGVAEDVVTAFRIPAFVAVVSGSIMFSICQGMVQALHLYLATYFFELSSSQITFLFAGAITGIVLGSLSSRLMAALIPEKRDLFIAGTAWYALWTSSVIMLRLLDVLPGNEHPLIAPLYITTGCISALGLGVAIPLIGSMIADITDEHERQHGRRQEGIYYSAGSLVAKVVGGAGPVLAGFIIDLAGIAPGAAPGDVDPASIERFGWATGPSVLLLSTISIACIWFYDISRQRHAEIIAQIEGRRT